MSELTEQVVEGIRSRHLLAEGQKFLVAVSGGLDSMVLLHLLHEQSSEHRWRLVVGHLNHQLRGRSSEADERLVRQTAKRLSWRCVVGRADVRAFAQKKKISIEMAARQARHEFLARTAIGSGIKTIVLAHHADDQVELFFLRLLRGSGAEGLGGMKWRGRSPVDSRVALVRPLLEVSKEELGAYARERKIRFREDASNASLDMQRNRIRHELLPLLKSKYQPALSDTVLRVMELLRGEAEFAETAARDLFQAQRAKSAAQNLHFSELPVAVQRHLLRLQLLEMGIVPGFGLIEELRAEVGRPVMVGLRSISGGGGEVSDTLMSKGEIGPSSRRRLAPGQSGGRPGASATPLCLLRTADGWLRQVEQKGVQFQTARLELDLLDSPGYAEFSGLRIKWAIKQETGDKERKLLSQREIFDAEKVGPAVVLRHWQPGDRFQPIGLGSAVKLQDIFVNQKVPRERRHQLVVAATEGNEIFWVEGLRIAERFKLTASTKRRLYWAWAQSHCVAASDRKW